MILKNNFKIITAFKCLISLGNIFHKYPLTIWHEFLTLNVVFNISFIPRGITTVKLLKVLIKESC